MTALTNSPWWGARKGRSPQETWSCRPWRADRVWWPGSIPSRPCHHDIRGLRGHHGLHDLGK